MTAEEEYEKLERVLFQLEQELHTPVGGRKSWTPRQPRLRDAVIKYRRAQFRSAVTAFWDAQTFVVPVYAEGGEGPRSNRDVFWSEGSGIRQALVDQLDTWLSSRKSFIPEGLLSERMYGPL